MSYLRRHGIILKDVALESLLESLREVAGGRRLSPLPLSDLTTPRAQREIANAQNVLTVLTERERQIMRLVSEGLSNKEIGRRLNIVDGTIKVHLHNIFRSWKSGTELCSRRLQRGCLLLCRTRLSALLGLLGPMAML